MRIKLEPLLDEPVEVETPDGRVFQADPELTASEAVYFMRFVSGASDVAAEGEAFLPQWSAVLSRCLARRHPEMTPEKVMETFSLRQILAVIAGFLALNGRMLRRAVDGAPTTPSRTTPQPTTGEASA